MDKRTLALLAAIGATTIYGLNHTIMKVIMPDYIGPYGLVLLRVISASILFGVLGLFYPTEKIDKQDYLRILTATAFGMCLNMVFFIKGLSLSTPINSSVIITIMPIIVLLLSAVFLSEKITWLKLFGIIFGFAGAITLVLYGSAFTKNAPNIPLGNAMMLINAFSYGAYLVILKPITKKYKVITLMKWMFPFGVLMNLPFGTQELLAVQWLELPWDALWRITYVLLFTTFLAYLLNMYALREVPPTTIGVLTYVQPIIAILYATFTGNDRMDEVKTLATLLVFLGVYLVTKKRKKAIK
ncbi:MAG: DMT family transporter [Flavobacteriaceae bacterium]|nr:DMT family transporter [Flavobacteriaceae bacterium]